MAKETTDIEQNDGVGGRVDPLVMRETCSCGHSVDEHDRGGKVCMVEGCTCSIVNFICKCGHSDLDHDWWGAGDCRRCNCDVFTAA